MMLPAREVLVRAERAGSAGDESGGFLSEVTGLLPREPPRTSLPPSHAAFDEMAARLPELFRTLRAREELDAMPVLDTGPDVLPDPFVWRACSLVGMFAHTYVRVLPSPVEGLPDGIEMPWATLCARLGRSQTALTYDDLIAYNWRLRDPAGPRRLENMDLLTPTVGNREEQVFYLAQVEMLAEGTPMIGAMVRAQEAAVAKDDAALERELVAIADTMERVGRGSFLKIDADPYSPTHVDPVVWAKTVAPFAVAIRESSHAISGAAAPLFQAVDAFIGRDRFESRVGRESRRLRPAFSPHFRAFVDGLAQVSVAEHVRERGSADLRGLWHTLLESYVGENGFLAIHRRKAFAFLELAFKVGRSVTTGGFTGLFEDQTWQVAHEELEASRQERIGDLASWTPLARPAEEARGNLAAPGLVHVELDLRRAGLRYRPGDRLSVIPENDPELVERTLRALRATGEEPIRLDGVWMAALRAEDPEPTVRPLRELLTRGQIRPVDRRVAKALTTVSGSERLARIVNAREEAAWELWDVLELLTKGGFDTRTIWRADPWEPYSVCKVVAPERARLYSIASAPPEADVPTADRASLLLSDLRYTSPQSEIAPDSPRHGTASGFLRRMTDGRAGARGVRVGVVPASRFRPPEDPTVPMVMIAGGAGISPFLGFIAERARQADPGPAWLVVSTRSEQHVELYRAQLERPLSAGWLQLHPVITGGEAVRSARTGVSGLLAKRAPELLELLLPSGEGGRGAVCYVCGAAGFAASVIAGLEAALGPLIGGDGPARELVRRMIGERRLQQDVFSSYRGSSRSLPTFDASEIALHNDPVHGAWTVLDGGVFDIAEFSHRHPGGRAIVLEHAGRDGTSAFRTIEHDRDPEIQAMLGMYRIGDVRRLEFGSAWSVGVGEGGLTLWLLADVFRAWVRLLYLVVEVENAVRHDFGILDAVTVAGDRPDQMTFLKARLLLEAHQRFLAIYLPSLLGARLDELWGMTASLVAPEEPIEWIQRELATVWAARPAREAAAQIETAWPWLSALGEASPEERDAGLAHLAALRPEVEGADVAFLVAAKSAIREGVVAFERWERETPARAGRAMLDPLLAIPTALGQLHERLAEVLLQTSAARGRGST